MRGLKKLRKNYFFGCLFIIIVYVVFFKYEKQPSLNTDEENQEVEESQKIDYSFYKVDHTVIKSGFIKGLIKVNDILYAPTDDNHLRDLVMDKRNFVPRPDDVVMIGYPKSGTTWTAEIIWLLQNDLNYEKCNRIFFPNFISNIIKILKFY